MHALVGQDVSNRMRLAVCANYIFHLLYSPVSLVRQQELPELHGISRKHMGTRGSSWEQGAGPHAVRPAGNKYLKAS